MDSARVPTAKDFSATVQLCFYREVEGVQIGMAAVGRAQALHAYLGAYSVGLEEGTHRLTQQQWQESGKERSEGMSSSCSRQGGDDLSSML